MKKLKFLLPLITILLLSTTVLANNGWQSINYWVFTVNGVPTKGWQTINGSWYYFEETYGFMMTNQWKETNGKWYYLGPDGKMLTNTYTPDGYWVDANGEWVQQTATSTYNNYSNSNYSNYSNYSNNTSNSSQYSSNSTTAGNAISSSNNSNNSTNANAAAASLGFDLNSIKQTLSSLGLSPSTLATLARGAISKSKYPLFHKHIINYMGNGWDALEAHVKSLNQNELDALSKEAMKVMTDTLGISSLEELSNKINSQGVGSLLGGLGGLGGGGSLLGSLLGF